jgi:hypothetical protein
VNHLLTGRHGGRSTRYQVANGTSLAPDTYLEGSNYGTTPRLRDLALKLDLSDKD